MITNYFIWRKSDGKFLAYVYPTLFPPNFADYEWENEPEMSNTLDDSLAAWWMPITPWETEPEPYYMKVMPGYGFGALQEAYMLIAQCLPSDDEYHVVRFVMCWHEELDEDDE